MGRKKRKVENNDPSSSSNPSAVDVVVAVGQNAPISSGAMIKPEALVVPPPHHPHPAIVAPDVATAATNIPFPPPFMAAVDPRRVSAVDPRRAAAVDPRAATMAARDPRFPPPPLTVSAVKEEPAQLAQLAQPTAAQSTATATSTAARIKSATMIHASTLAKKEADLVNDDEADLGTKPSSMYGLHSHSGDIVEEDIYVSSGSDESDDDDEEEEENDQKEVADDDGEGGTKKDDEAEKSTRTKTKKETTTNLLQKNSKNGKNNSPELVISTSKMGLMRRGGISGLLGGTTMHRQWVRGDAATLKNERGGDSSNAQGMQQSDQMNNEQQQNEEETITDPALLLAIQQRKIEQAKIQARITESSENAGRDPCLFSKRTAFDIRMDQIEDKPWDKGPANAPTGMPNSGGMDIIDYFNYGLTEEDWMEYAERQLAVRQELTDASKQKRLPDPAIVPVVPRAPSKQGDRVAVRVKKAEEENDGGGSIDADEKRGDDNDSEEDDESDAGVEVGPVKPAELEEKNEEGGVGGNDNGATTVDSISDKDNAKFDEEVKSETTDPEYNPEKIVGGAWGAGAAPDSVLLRLIQEQSGGGLATGIGLGMGMGMGMGMAGPPGMMAGMHNNMGMTMNVNLNIPPPGMGVSGMGIPPPPPPPPPPKNVPPPPPAKQDKDSHTSAGDSGHGHHGHHHPGGNINGGNMDWDQGSQNGGDGFHDRRGHGGSRGVGEDRHPHHPHNKFNRQGSITNSDPSHREWSGDGRDNRDVGSGSRGGGHNFPPPPHQHSRHQDYRQQQHQQHDQDPHNNGRQAEYQQQQRPPHPHHRRGGMEGDRRSERGGSTGGGGGEGFSQEPFAGRHPPNGPPQVPGGGGHGGGIYGQYPPNSYNDRRGGGGRGDGRDHRGRGPPPGRGGHPHGPPPHGWDGGGGRKRSRNDYGDPRGDQRRGRW